MQHFFAPTFVSQVPRRRSLPSDRLRFMRSALRPSPAQRFEEGLAIVQAQYIAGKADGFAGRPLQLTKTDLTERAGEPGVFSYLLGYRAGELERRGGALEAIGLAGGKRED